MSLSVAIVGSSLGPMLMGLARDVLGSYHAFLPFLALMPLAFAVAVAGIGHPRRIAQ